MKAVADQQLRSCILWTGIPKTGHVVESWPARLVDKRTAGMVGARTRSRRSSTVDQSCLIFVSPATHRHDLSLSFVAGLIARSVAAKQILQEEEHGQNPIWLTRCWSSA